MSKKLKSTDPLHSSTSPTFADLEPLLAEFWSYRFFKRARPELRRAALPFFIAAIAGAKDGADLQNVWPLLREAQELLAKHREDGARGAVLLDEAAQPPKEPWQRLLAFNGHQLMEALNEGLSKEQGAPSDPIISAQEGPSDPADAPTQVSPSASDTVEPLSSPAAAPATGDWPAPRALVDASGPDFPTEALPPWLSDFISGVADQTQIPPDAPAIWCLGALGAAMAKAVDVEVQRGDRHSTTLWVVAVLPSGGGKTPTLQEIRAPFDAFQTDLREEARKTAAVSETKVRVARRRMLSLEAQASREDDAEELARLIEESAQQREIIAQLETVGLPTLTTGDPSQASLVQLMAGNGGRILLVTDEGDQLFTRMRGAEEIECLLQAYSAATIERHRAGRRELRVHAPSLSLVMGIQPAAFGRIMSTRSFHDKGLLARLLFVVPRARTGVRKQRRDGLSDRARETYRRQVRRLLALSVVSPIKLAFSADAFEAFSGFAARVDNDLAEGELAELREWGQKLRGVVARLAGILHVLDHDVEQPITSTISRDTVMRAIAIGSYCEVHANIAFGPAIQSAEDENARKVLRWICDGERRTFRYVDAMRALNGRLSGADLTEALARLVDDGYLRPLTTQRATQRGRPAKADYRVHPLVFEAARKKLL